MIYYIPMYSYFFFIEPAIHAARTHRNAGIILLVCFLLFCSPLIAQHPDEVGIPFIRNHHAEEYNAHFQNWVAVQDHRGVMYFGNNDGILVYDGGNWEVIKVSGDPTVRSLAIDAGGRIFVGAISDLGYLAPNSLGSLSYVSLRNLIPEKYRKFADVWEAYAAEDGVYFACKDKIFHFFNNSISVLPVISNPQSIFSVYGKIINARQDDGLFLLEHGKARPLPLCSRFTQNDSGTVYILPYPGNKLMINTQKEGTFIYDLPAALQTTGRNQAPAGLLQKMPAEIDKHLLNSPYFRAEKLGPHHYAYCIWGGGIGIMDYKGKLERIINSTHGILGNYAINVFVDRDHNLWAMLDGGISYMETGAPISVFNASNGLTGVPVSALRHKGTLYAGTGKGAFRLSDIRTGDRTVKKFLPIEELQEQCYGFLAHRGMLLAGGEGLYQIDGTVGKKLIDTLTVLSLASSPKFPNHVFIGASGEFLALEMGFSQRGGDNPTLRGRELTVLRYKRFPQLKNEKIEGILIDRNGDLLMTASGQGLIHLRFTGPTIDDFDIHRYFTSKGLPSAPFNFLAYLKGKLHTFNSEGIYEAVFSKAESNPSISRFAFVNSFDRLEKVPSLTLSPDSIAKNEKVLVVAEKICGILGGSEPGQLKWNPFPFVKIDYAEYAYVESSGVSWICGQDGLFRYDPSVEKNFAVDYSAL
ncbi:MAG: hypothetical protein GY765_06210, partial [bacterium]|nr:hypothetical protein [bacterium]